MSKMRYAAASCTRVAHSPGCILRCVCRTAFMRVSLSIVALGGGGRSLERLHQRVAALDEQVGVGADGDERRAHLHVLLGALFFQRQDAHRLARLLDAAESV